jgi:hypothetical protein
MLSEGLEVIKFYFFYSQTQLPKTLSQSELDYTLHLVSRFFLVRPESKPDFAAKHKHFRGYCLVSSPLMVTAIDQLWD